jgi:hypothetical protein
VGWTEAELKDWAQLACYRLARQQAREKAMLLLIWEEQALGNYF